MRLLVFVISVVLLPAGNAADAPAALMEIRINGAPQEFWYVHPEDEKSVAPLVVLLHDNGGNGLRVINRGHFSAHARQNGYALLAPNLTTANPTPADSSLRQIIALVTQHPAIDAGRVYLIGYGSGASLAFAYVATTDHRVAGLAGVAGLPSNIPTDIEHATPTLLMTGSEDPLLPVQGIASGNAWQQPPPEVTFRQWARAMSCDVSVESTVAFIRHVKRSGCREGVMALYLEIGGLGHHWPRAGGELILPTSALGPQQNQFDATAVIWDFFAKQTPAISRTQ